MNPPNNKPLGARGVSQPFNRPTRRAPQFKAVVTQLKTAVSAQSVKRPVGPPVYRPQSPPKVLLSSAQRQHAGQAARGPIAPPRHRLPATSSGVQAKLGGSPRMESHLIGPPPYKPQPLPRVLQTKSDRSQRIASQRPGRGLPSGVNSLPSGSLTAQLKPQPVLRNRVPERRPPTQLKPVPSIAMNKAAVQRRIAPAARCGGPRTTHPAKVVQRAIIFTHGARLRQNNVAESIANMVDYGITKTTLNGHAYPGGSKEDFVTALLEPTLAVHDGSLGGAAVSVQSVPVQRLSYLMELPTRGTWQLKVAAANIRVKLANQPILEGVQIPIAADDANTLTMMVRGLPSNSIFGDLVEAHEDVHVDDIVTAINNILKPWDANLSRFRSQGTRFEGMTETLAKARLYRAAGGTPREVAERFVDTLRLMGNVFHQTAAGKAPSIVHIDKSGPVDDSLLEVYMRHGNALVTLAEQRLAAELERRTREREVYETAVSTSLATPVHGSINNGLGNSFITNDML